MSKMKTTRERLVYSYKLFEKNDVCLRMDTQEDVKTIKKFLDIINNSLGCENLGIDFDAYEQDGYTFKSKNYYLPGVLWFDPYTKTLVDHQDSNNTRYNYEDSYGNKWPDVEFSEYYRRAVTLDVFVNPDDYPEYLV